MAERRGQKNPNRDAWKGGFALEGVRSAFQAVHVMAAFEHLHRLGSVLNHKVDEPFQLSKVPLAALGLLLEVTRERSRELGGEPAHQAIAAAMRSAPVLKQY